MTTKKGLVHSRVVLVADNWHYWQAIICINFAETCSVEDSQDTSELELGTRAQSSNSPLLLCASGYSSSYHFHQGPDWCSKLPWKILCPHWLWEQGNTIWLSRISVHSTTNRPPKVWWPIPYHCCHCNPGAATGCQPRLYCQTQWAKE